MRWAGAAGGRGWAPAPAKPLLALPTLGSCRRCYLPHAGPLPPRTARPPLLQAGLAARGGGAVDGRLRHLGGASAAAHKQLVNLALVVRQALQSRLKLPQVACLGRSMQPLQRAARRRLRRLQRAARQAAAAAGRRRRRRTLHGTGRCERAAPQGSHVPHRRQGGRQQCHVMRHGRCCASVGSLQGAWKGGR